MSEQTDCVGVSMSLDPETDWNHQGRDGKGASSLPHDIDFPNGASIEPPHEAEKYRDEKEKSNDILLEKATEIGNETIQHQARILEEKLSAALSNLKAKDDMVKQHEKVAVEAVAGWDKAQTEVAVLRQQLEAACQKKSAVEDRANHLDEVLKECVKQLGQAREEQEQKIQEVVLQKTREWDSIRSDLESQLLQLQVSVESSKADSDLCYKVQFLETENLALKQDLVSQSEELEVRKIERDLNAQAAETASKQNLDSIRKLAKLEAENRNLKSIIGKSSSGVDYKSVSVSSMCVESLTDSQSDCREQMSAVEMSIVKLGVNECEPSCSDSWTSASFAELDIFKKQKPVNRSLKNSATEIDLMDDFLEMEHIAALSSTEPPAVPSQALCEQSSPSAKLEDLYQQIFELQEKMDKMEAEKTQHEDLLEKVREENLALGEKVVNMEKLNFALEEQKQNVDLRNSDLTDRLARIEEERTAFDTALVDGMRCIEMLKKQLKDNENTLEALQTELNKANDLKQYYEQQAIDSDVELKTMAAKVDALQEEVTAECTRSNKLKVKCENLEDALSRQKQELELELAGRLNAELKIKQEDLAATVVKLAECQQTIMSLGNQLQSMAALEDSLCNEKHSQLTVGGSLIPGPGGDLWKMHSNSAFLAKRETQTPNSPAKESNDHGVGCLSYKSVVKDHINNVKGENGHHKILQNLGEEEVSNNALGCDA